MSRNIHRPGTRAAAVLAVLALALVPACRDRVANPTVPIPSDFRLAVGQHVTVQPDNVEIGFREVQGDSRCPTNVRCFWQGEAGVQLTLTNASHQTQQVGISVEGHGSGKCVAVIAGDLRSLIPAPPTGRGETPPPAPRVRSTSPLPAPTAAPRATRT